MSQQKEVTSQSARLFTVLVSSTLIDGPTYFSEMRSVAKLPARFKIVLKLVHLFRSPIKFIQPRFWFLRAILSHFFTLLRHCPRLSSLKQRYNKCFLNLWIFFKNHGWISETPLQCLTILSLEHH